MADEMPIFPKAGLMYLHTGNIVNWNRIRKNPRQSATDEVKGCFGEVLRNWVADLDDQARTEAQYSTELECVRKEKVANSKLPENDRDKLKLTVKIYLYKMDPTAIKDAVEKVRESLGVSSIDALLVAVPSDKDLNLEKFHPVWEEMEALYDNDTAYSLGVTDFNHDQLQELYNRAHVKPSIDQVNLENCCIMPPELKEFAEDKDIQLLTHNDPTEILPVKTFQNTISSSCTERDSEHWQPDWLVRYSVIIRARGIITTKGYIVKGVRDVKHRK